MLSFYSRVTLVILDDHINQRKEKGMTAKELATQDMQNKDPKRGNLILQNGAVVLQTRNPREVIVWFKDTESTVKRRTVICETESTFHEVWKDIFPILAD